MAINNSINWAWLIETGRIQEAAPGEDYIIVGSFDTGNKTKSSASRTREYAIKVEDFLAASGSETFIDLKDTPVTYTGNALKGLRINAAEDAVEAYVSTDLNQWLMPGVAFVDKTNGSNVNGVNGDGNKAYKDIDYALTQSDQVLLLPGTYRETVFITADNQHVHAMAGVHFTSGGFRPQVGVTKFQFTGQAIFSGFSQCLRVYSLNAEIEFECDYIDDNRTVLWIESSLGLNASKVNFRANWILCNGVNGGGYCVRLLGSAEIHMNVTHYFHAQHSNFAVRSGTTGKLIVNCPEIKILANYRSGYGNAAKSILWLDSANGAYIEINGNLINEHAVYTFGRGCIEINNWTGAETKLIVNGDLIGNSNFCIFSQYRSAFGDIQINGNMISDRNGFFDELTGWGAVADQKWTFNGSIFDVQYHNLIGRGKTYSFKDCTILIREDGTLPNAGRMFTGLEPGSPASQSYLYFYNCTMQSLDTTLETFNISANFHVSTINTHSSLPIGAGVVDGWAGFTTIPTLVTPKIK